MMNKVGGYTDYCGKYHEMCAGNSYLCQAKSTNEAKSCAFYKEPKNRNQCANNNNGQCDIQKRSKRNEIQNTEIMVLLMLIGVVIVSVFMITSSTI